MNSKTLFNKEKELSDRLKAVVKSTWFQTALIYVRGEMMESPTLTTQHLEGARQFQDILLTFTDQEADQGEFPRPELYHDLDHITKKTDKSK